MDDFSYRPKWTSPNFFENLVFWPWWVSLLLLRTTVFLEKLSSMHTHTENWFNYQIALSLKLVLWILLFSCYMIWYSFEKSLLFTFNLIRKRTAIMSDIVFQIYWSIARNINKMHFESFIHLIPNWKKKRKEEKHIYVYAFLSLLASLNSKTFLISFPNRWVFSIGWFTILYIVLM